jgi:hypothetical protein
MEIKGWEAKMYAKRRIKMLEQAGLNSIEPLVTQISIEIEERQLSNPEEIVKLIKRRVCGFTKSNCDCRALVNVLTKILHLKKNLREEIRNYLKKEEQKLYLKILRY